MKEREAIILYKSNGLKKIIIQPSAENYGWVLKLIGDNGIENMLTSKRGENEPRIFKTVDACINCCKRIGLNNATLTYLE